MKKYWRNLRRNPCRDFPGEVYAETLLEITERLAWLISEEIDERLPGYIE